MGDWWSATAWTSQPQFSSKMAQFLYDGFIVMVCLIPLCWRVSFWHLRSSGHYLRTFNSTLITFPTTFAIRPCVASSFSWPILSFYRCCALIPVHQANLSSKLDGWCCSHWRYQSPLLPQRQPSYRQPLDSFDECFFTSWHFALVARYYETFHEPMSSITSFSRSFIARDGLKAREASRSSCIC